MGKRKITGYVYFFVFVCYLVARKAFCIYSESSTVLSHRLLVQIYFLFCFVFTKPLMFNYFHYNIARHK